MTLPEVGEKVTVVVRWLEWKWGAHRVAPGVVKGRLLRDADRGVPMYGFSVDVGDRDGSQINLWELDPDYQEGIGWARGWEGPAVEALKAAEALF